MHLENIADAYRSAVILRCREDKKGRCEIKLDTGKEFVMLKGEAVASSAEKMCDCMIFQNDCRIILVELKSRRLDPDEIREKFYNSAKNALSIASDASRHNFRVYMILLAKDFKRTTGLRIIQSLKIHIYGKSYTIHTSKCGASLNDVIGSGRASGSYN